LQLNLAIRLTFDNLPYSENHQPRQKSLDITWIKDKSLVKLDTLLGPDELVIEKVENLETGLKNS